MAYTYRIDSTRALAIITGGRHWSGDDLMESRREVVRAPGFEPAFDWIYDLRRVFHIVFLPRHLERAVDQFRTLREEGWIECSSRSVLMARDEDVRLTGELYRRKVDCPASQFRIARTIDAAYRWLAENEPRQAPARRPSAS
jgi:hypothetical protein